MNRNVNFEKIASPLPGTVSTADQKATVQKPDDPISARVIKLIPAEIVAVYLAAYNLVKEYELQNKINSPVFQWVIFGISLLFTPVYLSRNEGVTRKNQLAISTTAFILWAFSIGGPLNGVKWGGYSIQSIATAAIILFSLLTGILYNPQQPAPPPPIPGH
jgi:hypothetical protein